MNQKNEYLICLGNGLMLEADTPHSMFSGVWSLKATSGANRCKVASAEGSMEVAGGISG